MTWPTIFGNLFGGNQPLSLIDGMFQQTAQMIEVPCSASGATAISLTPLVNCPVLNGYTEFCAARFRAAANSGAGVTAQVNGLGFLPVYKADGVTQCGLNDLVIGFEYVVRFSQALGGGVGGWFLEAPAFGSGGGGGGTGTGIWTPGGRLTLVSSQPVLTSSVTSTTIWYAPYVHPFVPIYNGSTVQMYQFTSGLADTVGLSLVMGTATWPPSAAFDLYVALNAGVLVLGSVQWAHPGPIPPPARTIPLQIFSGFLTNQSGISLQINTSTNISVPANQATFLGSFVTGVAGQTQFAFGAPASGGIAGSFLLCNYYNKVLFNTAVQDTGAPYTYTSATVRPARNSGGALIQYMQSDSERAASLVYLASNKYAAASGAGPLVGIGLQPSAFNTYTATQNSAAVAINVVSNTIFQVASTGLTTIWALEAGDGVNANTFDANSNNLLYGEHVVVKINDLPKYDAAIRAVCPHIDGVAADGEIFFQKEATAEQRAAAAAAGAAYADPAPAPIPDLRLLIEELVRLKVLPPASVAAVQRPAPAPMVPPKISLP